MGVTYICNDCGHVFDGDGNEHYDSDTGYRWIQCPACGESSDIEECVRCKDCDEAIPQSEDMYHGYCRECAEDRFLTPQNVKKYLADRRNFEDFVNFMIEHFSNDTIIEMIYDSFPEECEDYCSGELDYFLDMIDS